MNYCCKCGKSVNNGKKVCFACRKKYESKKKSPTKSRFIADTIYSFVCALVMLLSIICLIFIAPEDGSYAALYVLFYPLFGLALNGGSIIAAISTIICSFKFKNNELILFFNIINILINVLYFYLFYFYLSNFYY